MPAAHCWRRNKGTTDMMQRDVLELREKLEPGTVTTERTVEEASLASIAISLRRIADAVWGNEGNAGILQIMCEATNFNIPR